MFGFAARRCANVLLIWGAWGLSDAMAAEPVQSELGRQERLQQERERALRQQQEITPDVRSGKPESVAIPEEYPENETPCFVINRIELVGEESKQFQFTLDAVNRGDHLALGRCLGVQGVNSVMARVQNVLIARGYSTTRVLAAPQDLSHGQLQLTVIPGRISRIRFTEDSSTPRGALWNALPFRAGDILNARAIEQALENMKRVPTVDADFQITPSDAPKASPGQSDIVIRYRQAFPLRLTLSADDGGSDATGKYQGGITLSGDSLLTLNDLVYINYNHDLGGGDPGRRGTKGHTFHYSIPYGYWLLSATGSDFNYYQQVAGLNQTYLYSGQSQNAEVKLSRIVFRNAINKTQVILGSFFKKSSNFIDDTEIEAQRRRTAGWTLGLNQSWYIGKSTLDYTLGWKRGTGAMEALRAPEENSGEGTSRMEILTGEVNLAVPFELSAGPFRALRYNGTLRFQNNYTPLTPQDRFAIGNRYTVRGFDGALTLSAERGVFLRNDISAPLGQSNQQLYLGVDYGEVAGPSAEWLLGKRLAGAVIGLRGGYKSLSYDFFTGQPLKKPDGFQTAHTTAGFNLNLSF